MNLLRFTWALMLCCLHTTGIAAPLDFSAPAFLTGPLIARAATGNTYLYTGTAEFRDVELRISVVEIPQELAQDGPTPCVEAYLAELRQTLPSLFAARDAIPLRIGSIAVEPWRWISIEQNYGLRTGVVSCGIYRDRYISAVFHDNVKSASSSFPLIRAALTDLSLP
ncbi:MAG: hypothetical protein EXR86_10280 [Gammaproteobacteria bacterium]|nr:hypothetical protein [Gammaproteobacteria bacterium]